MCSPPGGARLNPDPLRIAGTECSLNDCVEGISPHANLRLTGDSAALGLACQQPLDHALEVGGGIRNVFGIRFEVVLDLAILGLLQQHGPGSGCLKCSQIAFAASGSVEYQLRPPQKGAVVRSEYARDDVDPVSVAQSPETAEPCRTVWMHDRAGVPDEEEIDVPLALRQIDFRKEVAIEAKQIRGASVYKARSPQPISRRRVGHHEIGQRQKVGIL